MQLAIKHGHYEMVKKLLPQCTFTHLDSNDNSLFHYAAPNTKEIINVNKLCYFLKTLLLLLLLCIMYYIIDRTGVECPPDDIHVMEL